MQSAGGKIEHSHLDSIIEGNSSGAALSAPSAKGGHAPVTSAGADEQWYKNIQVGTLLLGTHPNTPEQEKMLCTGPNPFEADFQRYTYLTLTMYRYLLKLMVMPNVFTGVYRGLNVALNANTLL